MAGMIATTLAELPTSNAINLRRLLLVRALTLAVLLLTLAFAVRQLGMPLPVVPILLVLAVVTALSLASLWRLRRDWPVGDPELFVQLLVDVAALTVLLYLTGGSTNPFVTLYLLPLAVAAASLPSGYVWSMAVIGTLCYSSLLAWHVPLPQSEHAHASGDFGVHVLGMWVGFVLSAGLIAGVAVRMNSTLREHERALARLREQTLKQERVVALGTLATGAAHELGTPLSTMAVLVKDIEPGQGVSAEKLGILRAQIARCKEILASLSSATGQVRAEAGRRVVLEVFLNDIVSRWRAQRPAVQATLRLAGPQPPPSLVADQTLSQAITNILNNAADASPSNVEINGRWTQDELTLDIADRGPGLTPELADRAGQPFLTTKSDGLGLGLFLAYSTLNRLGGEVRLLPRDGGGLCCRISLPLADLKVSD